jgi:hypothetical protein
VTGLPIAFRQPRRVLLGTRNIRSSALLEQENADVRRRLSEIASHQHGRTEPSRDGSRRRHQRAPRRSRAPPRAAGLLTKWETAIEAELRKIPHASLVARESKGAWSYATVWRVTDRAGNELTAGRKTHWPAAVAAAAGESSKPSRNIPKRSSWTWHGRSGSAARRLAER